MDIHDVIVGGKLAKRMRDVEHKATLNGVVPNMGMRFVLGFCVGRLVTEGTPVEALVDYVRDCAQFSVEKKVS